MGIFGRDKTAMIDAGDALEGRAQRPFALSGIHAVNGRHIEPPFPDSVDVAVFAMGCFWGAERKLWETTGVYTTAVGYVAGHTPNPTYEEVCSGRTGHTEAVLAAFDPQHVSYEDLLRAFWEGHDPTQGMRQGNDVGTQYRSGIYVLTPAQRSAAEASKAMFGERLAAAGYGPVTTEIVDIALDGFWYAEEHHQQYLHKVPNGYCGLGGTGVSCPVGVA